MRDIKEPADRCGQALFSAGERSLKLKTEVEETADKVGAIFARLGQVATALASVKSDLDQAVTSNPAVTTAGGVVEAAEKQ